jgi:hypothetical protein
MSWKSLARAELAELHEVASKKREERSAKVATAALAKRTIWARISGRSAH